MQYSCEAACLAELQSNGEEVGDQTALNAMMAEVPKNLKKIAGKSLPIEVSPAFLNRYMASLTAIALRNSCHGKQGSLLLRIIG